MLLSDTRYQKAKGLSSFQLRETNSMKEAFITSSHSLIYIKSSSYIMELEVSLPSSQEPASGLHSEPDESNPHFPPPPHYILIKSFFLAF
jgi:hypothetical protein